jgi:eukaryotic-like serine/threonine-protein kinase
VLYSEIGEKGRGGFARVMIIADEITEEKFAKKIYAPQEHLVNAVGDEHLKKRFKREVRYQDSIDHPNVVKILEHFLDDEPPYFIMPLANCTLKDEVEADITLGGNPRKALFDILAGLEAVHSAGFVHRDLKPSNVLKFVSESDDVYALSDFGLIAGVNSDSTALTGPNDTGGTPNYAAPELIRGLRAATPLADIYSFGAILHDIFGNGAIRVPYTELTVSGDLGKIVSKCTKKLSSRRYRRVSELREDLYNVLNKDDLVFSSSNEEVVVDLLRSNTSLTGDQWDTVFLQLEENSANSASSGNIFSSIAEHHINDLYSVAPELFAALGEYFADYIGNNSFDFNYCDILASRGQLFYNLGDIQLKARIAIALLVLGTSHNRWYVERKFITMAGEAITDQLAKRIKIELEVQNIKFDIEINHLKQSIGVDSSVLHPILQQLLSGN